MRRRYGGYGRGKRPGSRRTAALTLLFWAVSGMIMIGFVHGGPPALLEGKSEDVGKLYIGSVFPTVSRGTDFEAREAGSFPPASSGTPEEGGNPGRSGAIFQSMVGSMFPGAQVLDDDLAEEDPGIIFDTERGDEGTEAAGEEPPEVVGSGDGDSPKTVASIDSSKPLVIIYHTHATESYQPVEEGNFHSLNEYGTVREVGDVMAKELEKQGIQVIHDKTIHDSPSYNQSYTRSLETIRALMGSNESARMVVVDLHRDAAAYSGNVGKTVSIGKETPASYSLVIGTGNPNLEALRLFANQINRTAEEMYPGFGGKIIEKQYKFNQHVSDYHLLLEVGNNQNTIEQAKLSGKYFAKVLAKAIKDME